MGMELGAATALGFLFGFFGSMPIAGPLALVIFGRALEGKAREARRVAMGGAVGELPYAFFSFLGVAHVVERVAWFPMAAQGLAALVLIGVGVHYSVPRGAPQGGEETRPSQASQTPFWTGFVMTFLNLSMLATWGTATTIALSFAWVEPTLLGGVGFTLGAFGGVVAWFAMLIAWVGRQRQKWSPRWIRALMRTAGAALVAIGLVFAYRFLMLWW